MKKFLKILAIAILTIFLVLLILPFAFQGKITQLTKEEINKNLNAKVDFEKVDLSFISSFPNVEFSLEDLSIVGLDDFENDRLAFIGEISAKVSLTDLFKDPIAIKAIVIDRPQINAQVLKNEKANWDIAKASDTTAANEKTTDASASDESAFKLRLQQFKINDAQIVYNDQAAGMQSHIEDFDFVMRGDFSADHTTLNMQSQVKALSFEMDGIKYLNKSQVSLDADIDADLKNSKYTFIKNIFRLNALELGFDGWVSMPKDDIEMGMTFDSKQNDFKHILSLVPAIYMTDFQELKTSGKMSVNGQLKGIYNEKRLPAFNVNVLVDNAQFQYPDLPSAAENIEMDLNISNVDGVDDHTLINLKNFHIEMAQNPFDMKMKITKPVSDPHFDGSAKGTINLDKLKDVIPLEDMQVAGIIKSNIEMKGKLSSLENERYEEVHAMGDVLLNNLKYTDADYPQGINISSAKATLTPKHIRLQHLEGKTGNSDFRLKGTMDHLLAWFFNDDVLSANFDFSSNKIVLADFMGNNTAEEPTNNNETADTATNSSNETTSAIEIPSNIEFVLQSKIGEVVYDNLSINDVIGKITLHDSKAAMEKLQMKLLGGEMKLNGYYSSKNIEKPAFNFAVEALKIDAKKSFEDLNTIQKLAPIAKYAQGNVSTKLSISGLMKSDMNVDLSSINSSGRLQSDNLSIKNAGVLHQISSLIKSDIFNHIHLKNMNLSYKMKDGKLEITPFDVKIGKSKATIGGHQSLDQSMRYTMNFNIPSSVFGAQANKVANTLFGEVGKFGVDLKVPEYINLKTIITGTLTQPEVKLDRKGQESSLADALKKQAQEKLKEESDKAKKKAIEEAQKQADKLLDEADKQGKKLISEAEKVAEKGRKEAYKQADALKDEGYKQADALIKKAGNNPIKKELAKKAAEKIKKETDINTNKIKAEADKQKNKNIQLAKDQAEKLKNKAKKEGDALIEKAKKTK